MESLKKSARSPAIVVAALVGIYMLSQFFRNSISVIAPNLAQEFDLDAASLGLLSSVFFLAFSATQIPLGIAIDRWGPKAPMVSTALVMIGATVFFAMAADARQLSIARLLLGVGCCAYFMAPLALYAGLFKPERFSTIASIHLGGGSLGMLMATAPLAYGVAAFGWRNMFLFAAGFATLMTLSVMLFVHEAPAAAQARKARQESWGETFAGIAAATRARGFWSLFFMQAAGSAAFATILGLWAGPWLAQVYHFDLGERGNLTLVFAIAQIAAVFAWGPSDRLFQSYRIPVLIGSGLAVALLALAALVEIPRAALPWFLAVYGASLGFFPLVVAHGKALFPPALTGRGITLLNMGTMGGTFVQQSVTGFAIEAFGSTLVDGARHYPPEAYRLVFAILGAQLALAAWFYRRAPDRDEALAQQG